MTQKRNLLFLIIGFLALIGTGYALFVTVFDQIISQNEGFFYALVFGGILILAYILINIIAKLMIITDKAHHSKALVFVCIFGLICVCVLFALSSLRYNTTISANEATYYAAGSMISNETLSASSDLINKIVDNPAQYLYALLFSFLFNFVEDSSSLLVIVNVALSCVSAVFAYLLTIKIADKLCGLCAAFVMLFLPGQLYCVYSYSTECFVSVLFLAMLFFGVELMCAQKKSSGVIYGIFYSIFAALMLASEPVSIIAVILLIIGGFALKFKNKGGFVIFSFVALVLFAGLMYYKSIQINQDFILTLQGALNCFDNSTVLSTGAINTGADIKSFFDSLISADNSHIENNVYYLMAEDGTAPSTLVAAWLTLGNQVAFMFVLILCISSIFFSIVNKDNRLYPYLCAVLAFFVILYFEVSRESHGYTLRCILSIIAAVGIHYIYLNHHPEETFAWARLRGESAKEGADENENESAENEEALRIAEEEMLRRANALIFVDDNVELYNQIKTEEKQKAFVRQVLDEDATKALAEPVSAPIAEPLAEPVSAPIAEPAAEPVIETESKPEVTYIENPLPVPERRPHSSVDYDYDVDDSDYDWDIDVSDDDY